MMISIARLPLKPFIVLQMIGCLQAPRQAKLASLKPLISSKAGLTMDGKTLDLLEEVRPHMCDLLPDTWTLAEAQLEDGDILIAIYRPETDCIPRVRMTIQLSYCLKVSTCILFFRICTNPLHISYASTLVVLAPEDCFCPQACP